MLGRIGIAGMEVPGSGFKELSIFRGLGRHSIPGIAAESQPSSALGSRSVTHRYRGNGSMDDHGLADCLLTTGHGHTLQDWKRTAAQDEAVAVRVQDTRDGLYTLLDRNVRPGEWQTLCIARGRETPHSRYHHMTGALIPTSHMYPRPGMRWVRTVTAAGAGTRVARVGNTTPSRYGRSASGRDTFSARNRSDLFPPVGDLAMLAAHFAHKTHITSTKETPT